MRLRERLMCLGVDSGAERVQCQKSMFQLTVRNAETYKASSTVTAPMVRPCQDAGQCTDCGVPGAACTVCTFVKQTSHLRSCMKALLRRKFSCHLSISDSREL